LVTLSNWIYREQYRHSDRHSDGQQYLLTDILPTGLLLHMGLYPTAEILYSLKDEMVAVL